MAQLYIRCLEHRIYIVHVTFHKYQFSLIIIYIVIIIQNKGICICQFHENRYLYIGISVKSCIGATLHSIKEQTRLDDVVLYMSYTVKNGNLIKCKLTTFLLMNDRDGGWCVTRWFVLYVMIENSQAIQWQTLYLYVEIDIVWTEYEAVPLTIVYI